MQPQKATGPRLITLSDVKPTPESADERAISNVMEAFSSTLAECETRAENGGAITSVKRSIRGVMCSAELGYEEESYYGRFSVTGLVLSEADLCQRVASVLAQTTGFDVMPAERGEGEGWSLIGAWTPSPHFRAPLSGVREAA